MRGEGPEDVFLAADLAQAQTPGIDILEAADLSGLDHFLEPDDGRMVMQDVPDKERLLPFRGQAYQRCAIPLGEGQRLFHEDMLAGLQGLFGNVKMQGGGRGDNYACNIIIHEDIGDVGSDDEGDRFEICPPIGLAHFLADGVGAIADGFENTQLVEIADEVLAPVAGADYGDVWG